MSGPPLDYIGEKLKSSLECQHGILENIKTCVPDNLPLPTHYQQGSKLSVKTDLLASPAFTAFYFQVVAFAALFNMLGSIRSPDDAVKLAEMPKKDFLRWLDIIEREGSVLG